MLANRVQAWLDADGSYAQGVALYRETGGLQPLTYFERELSQTYISPEMKAKLRQSLQRFVNIHAPDNAYTQPKPSTRQAQSPEPADTAEPPAILALREKAIPLHKRYSHLKAELYAATREPMRSEHDRFSIAEEIMQEVIPALDNIYDQIRDWQRTGEVPNMPRNEMMEYTVKRFRLYHSSRSAMANLKRSLSAQGLSDADRMRYEQLIADKELLMAEIAEELGL